MGNLSRAIFAFAILWCIGAGGFMPRAGADGMEESAGDWRECLAGRRLLRIGLKMGASQIDLVCDGAFKIVKNDRPWRDGEAGEKLGFSGNMTDRIALVPTERGIWKVKINGQSLPSQYAGAMEIFSSYGKSANGAVKSGLTLVNTLPLEEYIAGVVPREMPTTFGIEALKAQAIAARSYTLYYLGRHQAEGFDLCAGTHCQIYSGRPDALSRACTAVYNTRGQIMIYQDQPVKALYHSTCGGETADGIYLDRNSDDLPYLRGVTDIPDADSRLNGEAAVSKFIANFPRAYCDISKRYRWEAIYTAAAVNALIAENLAKLVGQSSLKPGKVKDLRIAERDAGRVKALEVQCEAGDFLVKEDAIRWLFGRGNGRGLQSTFFTLKVERDKAGNPTKYIFSGAGWGHGVGMCQYGAEGRARAGQSAAEILRTYYPGTELWTEAE